MNPQQNGCFGAPACPVDLRELPLAARLDLLDDADRTGLHRTEHSHDSVRLDPDALSWPAPPRLSRRGGVA